MSGKQCVTLLQVHPVFIIHSFRLPFDSSSYMYCKQCVTLLQVHPVFISLNTEIVLSTLHMQSQNDQNINVIQELERVTSFFWLVALSRSRSILQPASFIWRSVVFSESVKMRDIIQAVLL